MGKRRSHEILRRAALTLALVTGLASCDAGSGSDGVGAGDAPSPAGGPTDPSQRSDAGQADSPPCAAYADGSLQSSIGSLLFAGSRAQVIVKQDAAKGCVHEATLFVGDSDCTLELTVVSEQGEWVVRRGVASIGADCGVDVAAEYYGTWTLATESVSTGGLDGAPRTLEMDEGGCVDAAALQPTGVLQFELGDAELELNLNGLTLSGSAASTDAVVESCPATIEVCPAQACGPDAYGKACGTCGDGFACLEGQCQYWNCPPEGPFGVEPGEVLTDVALKDCDGNDYRLHDLCGADAAYINVLAGW